MKKKLFDGPIHIVGLGCSGSYVGLHLGKKGAGIVKEVQGYDNGIVDIGNCLSQMYSKRHVKHPKTDSLAEQMLEWGEVELVGHHGSIDGSLELSGVVFLCLDSMNMHWKLWESSIHKNDAVSLMIETRLERTTSLIHVVDPMNDEHVRMWKRYWYPDDEVTTTGSCGAATSLGPIADLTANLAVWQLIRAAEIEAGYDDRLDNQIRIAMRPLKIETHQW